MVSPYPEEGVPLSCAYTHVLYHEYRGKKNLCMHVSLGTEMGKNHLTHNATMTGFKNAFGGY